MAGGRQEDGFAKRCCQVVLGRGHLGLSLSRGIIAHLPWTPPVQPGRSSLQGHLIEKVGPPPRCAHWNSRDNVPGPSVHGTCLSCPLPEELLLLYLLHTWFLPWRNDWTREPQDTNLPGCSCMQVSKLGLERQHEATVGMG